VDLERQGGECWESDDEDEGRKRLVRRFFTHIRDALSSPKVRVYLLIITMMLILLGISVGRLRVLERRASHGTHAHVGEPVAGDVGMENCCVEIVGSFVSWDS
jgi:hypothetical protein